MSMHYYPEFGYGLFIHKDEFNMLNINEYDCEDIKGFRKIDNERYDSNGITSLAAEWSEEYVNGYFFYSEKQGWIIVGNEELYNSIEEMADEFRKKLKDILPDDFDIILHLGLFYGAVLS